MIDLAGSEKASESLSRRKEGGFINKSLLTLGNVIAKLAEKKEYVMGNKNKKHYTCVVADVITVIRVIAARRQHIPYRDSKLTRILEPALSGNSRIAIICTITLASGTSSAHSMSLASSLSVLVPPVFVFVR